MPKSAQRQFLVKVNGIEGYFARKTGGNISSDVTKVYDGGSTRPENVPGPPQADDVTVGRPYDPYRDAPVLADLRRRVGSFVTTVSFTPTDADLVPIAEPTVYSNALLNGVNEPEADASSGDSAMFELTFAIAGWV